MSIPKFNAAGVIPPFLKDPRLMGRGSPYPASSSDVAQHFATSQRRCEILQGWLDYRARLLNLGMTGFQWIDGSFCEDLTRANREPGDIDVVTFWAPPEQTDPDAFEEDLWAKHRALVDPKLTKQTFQTDAYFVRLENKEWAPVVLVHYWFGLFSHRRNDSAWKGIVQVPLDAGDDARAYAVVLARLAKPQPSDGGSVEQSVESKAP